MLQKIREWLTLILIGLLPLHALLVTVGTKYLAGFGAAPLPYLALWKEALLGILFLLVILEWLFYEREEKVASFAIDRFDYFILLLIVLSAAVTAFTHRDWRLYLFGFKYDFVPLIAFIILRRCVWSEWFRHAVVTVILTLGGLVALYGLATLVLPDQFFRALGYSDLHSLYVSDAPLAAFQQVGGGGVRRMQSTLSGPNQLGLWLLLPWSFGIAFLFSSWMKKEHPIMGLKEEQSGKRFPFFILYVGLIGAALFFTFSRTAWVAAASVVIVFILMNLPWQRALRQLVRLFGVGMMALIILAVVKPGTIVRFASTRDHLLKPLAAVQSIIRYPFGQGLGVAGPASNRVSDACVFLEKGSNASWAEDRPNLCVFVGGRQVQPLGRNCNCPRVIENWYLQMGVEMGLLGFFVYLALTLGLLFQLASFSTVFLPFFGMSIAALFLHAWEGSAVAYTLWVLIAVEMTKKKE